MEKELEIHFGSKLDEGAQFILFSEVRRYGIWAFTSVSALGFADFV